MHDNQWTGAYVGSGYKLQCQSVCLCVCICISVGGEEIFGVGDVFFTIANSIGAVHFEKFNDPCKWDLKNP